MAAVNKAPTTAHGTIYSDAECPLGELVEVNQPDECNTTSELEAQNLARACMPPPACMLPPALILVPAWILVLPMILVLVFELALACIPFEKSGYGGSTEATLSRAVRHVLL